MYKRQGMSRLNQANVLAMSGRAIEAAGDVDILLLDKTGTITLGNRQASRFIPVDGADMEELADAAQLSSLADETPEGRSIVVLAKEKFGIRGRNMEELGAVFVPFTAKTRMSGVDYGENQVRKGAADAIKEYVLEKGGTYSADCDRIVTQIAQSGGCLLYTSSARQRLWNGHHTRSGPGPNRRPGSRSDYRPSETEGEELPPEEPQVPLLNLVQNAEGLNEVTIDLTNQKVDIKNDENHEGMVMTVRIGGDGGTLRDNLDDATTLFTFTTNRQVSGQGLGAMAAAPSFPTGARSTLTAEVTVPEGQPLLLSCRGKLVGYDDFGVFVIAEQGPVDNGFFYHQVDESRYSFLPVSYTHLLMYLPRGMASRTSTIT